MLRSLSVLLLAAAGCSEEEAAPPKTKEAAVAQRQIAAPAQPGESRGLPDDGTPKSEARGKAGGAQEAATVAETYYALIEAGKYREAWKLRWPAKGDDPEAFARNFGKYDTYRATVGAPSEPQGAAGSLFVEVPVQIYGRLKNGEGFGTAGSITLRRSNDVPGSTPEQRKWRIYSGG